MSKGFVIRMKSTEAVELATKEIDSYSKAVQGRIRGVIRKGTMAIYDSAVRMAPMGKTGNLKQGIRFRSANDWQSGEVVSTAPHSRAVEMGTGPRITYPDPRLGKRHAMKMPDGRFVKGDIYNGQMPKHPFMRPAYLKEKDKIEADMKEVIEHDPD